MRSLGLVGEPILRVGRSVAGGVRRASEERAASLSLIPWSLEGDLRTMLLGDAVDEIAASALSPTALAWFDTEPATRLLVSVESANLQPGLRDDVAMALSLAASIAKRRRRIFSMGPIDDTALRSAGIEVPPSVEATPGPDDRQAWLDERWRSGDLIIMASCGNPRGSD
ncbi:MAG: hypothetical protein OES13_07785, partial [Acidimicrobiia bacterium]|nr:hypothetical protein [Acidimicrobiia bacterium]